MNVTPDTKLGATPAAPPGAALSATELVRRRRAARRIAWGLALLVLVLYVGGMLFKR